jgi:hypothetical protein
VSGDGPPSLSWAIAVRPIEPPTRVSAGTASSASICGQRFKVPLTATLPTCGAWWQESAIDTGAV